MVKKIGEYYLERHIGQGNYGSVYAGHHITSGEPIAAKSVSISILEGKLLQQLECEIKVLKSLRNAYIIRLIEVYKTRNNVYLIMEYCPGGDLAEYMKKMGRVEESLAKKWLRQLVEASYVMQLNHVMHRDLKLANILLTDQGPEPDIRICDFGFARYLNDDLAKTQLGTPIFMAPEIFNGEAYSYKADVWSLGVLSYEILSGRAAFQCKTIPQLKALQQISVSFPADIPISAGAKEFVQSLLTYNPSNRPTFEELRTHPFFEDETRIPDDEYMDLGVISDDEFEMLESIDDLNPEALELEGQLTQVEEIFGYYRTLLSDGNVRATFILILYAQKMFKKYTQVAEELSSNFGDTLSNYLKDRIRINSTEIENLFQELIQRLGIDMNSFDCWTEEFTMRFLDHCEDRSKQNTTPEELKITLKLLAVVIDLEPSNHKALELFTSINQMLRGINHMNSK